MYNTINKLRTEKWMMEKSSLYSFYDTVSHLENVRTGGLKGLIFGNPLVAKMQGELVPSAGFSGEGDMAIIHVCGILTKSPNPDEQQALGLCDTDEISEALDQAAADPSVKCIILSFNSPGGDTCGIAELGRKIKRINDTIKPIYAWTETGMNSAAMWLAVNTGYIGMTETAAVGSCGVYMIVLDCSKKYEKEGLNPQVIAAETSPMKMIGHDMRPLSSTEHAVLLEDVNRQHQSFMQVVKDNRPNIQDEALTGLSYEGPDALKLGWVDTVEEDFDSFLAKVQQEQ